MNGHELDLIARKAASLEEETEIMTKMTTLKEEIKKIYNDLEDVKQAASTVTQGWRFERKAQKVDEKIACLEITLESELKTINEKYDLKEKKEKLDLDAKLKKIQEHEESEIERLRLYFEARRNKAREQYDTEMEKLKLERERGVEGKTNEYDTYILKKEKEKESFNHDKAAYIENTPKKITEIRNNRLLRQKVNEYNRIIARHNAFYKGKDFQLQENHGLDFLFQKGSHPSPQPEKNFNTPLNFFSKKTEGGSEIFFQEKVEGGVPPIPSPPTAISIPELPPSTPPKKAVRKKAPEPKPMTSIQTDLAVEEESESDESVSSIDSYERFRQQYKELYGEELPGRPEPL